MNNSLNKKLSYCFIEPSSSLHSQSFLNSLLWSASKLQQLRVSVLCPNQIISSLLLTRPSFNIYTFNLLSLLKIAWCSFRETSIIHFTKIESYLCQTIILSYLAFPLSKIVCTIHWLPVTRTSALNITDIKPFVHFIFLKILSWRIKFFIVHTEECFLHLKRLGIKSILASYPLDIEQLKLKANLQRPNSNHKLLDIQKKQVLFVGDIRLDKGIELVSKLTSYLPCYCELIVAGNNKSLPQKFNAYLKSLAYNSNQFIYKPGFVRDEELISLIGEADVILLPYNNLHRGASGILGLAALAETPVIASNNHNISEVVKKYSLGLVADLSVKSFSSALNSILNNDYYHSPDTSGFYRDHSPDIYLKAIINSI